MLVIIASVLLAVFYAALMEAYLRGWRALPEYEMPEEWVPTAMVSVLVPARNEASHIEACLRSILSCSYPAHLLEIIVIDDYSEDNTRQVVLEMASEVPAIRLLRLSDFNVPDTILSHKKKAIEIGVAHARGAIIVTTDADCVAPVDWLRWMVGGILASPARRDVQLLAAPVAFHREQNLLQRFQSLDFLGLMGITGAGIQLGWQRMGNGANLAYRKSVFEEAGGFKGNENVASGDDMFLIQKVAARYPGGVAFLKNPAAIVLTEAKPDWLSFWQQRLRWGSKNAALPEWPVRLALLTVFLFCWSIVLTVGWLLWSLLVPCTNGVRTISALLLVQLLVKSTADYRFLREMCMWFARRDLLRWFWPSFLLHTAYIVVVGTASLFFKNYVWKGREHSTR